MSQPKPRIAHLSGPTATIQNTPPLITSNQARRRHGLPLVTDPEGNPVRFDPLRAQRLAAPVTVYVEQFSAHPLEADAAELYGPPDGYLDAAGTFRAERGSDADRPVYALELRPEDGLFPLPYMARQRDGSAWDDDAAFRFAPAEHARQSFFPDGSRSFEEIDRLSIGEHGEANLIGSRAEVRFHRVLPPGGYTKGEPAERRGVDFFPYRPYHLNAPAPRGALARSANAANDLLSSGEYDGAIWTEGSPIIEESVYWLNLLVDTALPICANAAQRPQGQISNDGPKNLVDSVEYIRSRVWADDDGRDRVGVVLIAEQRIFAARVVAKLDARPGGYGVSGGNGGILGACGHDGPPVLQFVPTTRHTRRSELNRSRLPSIVRAVRADERGLSLRDLAIKDETGRLREAAIPRVVIVKDAAYAAGGDDDDVDVVALMDATLRAGGLGGFVVEGLTPYGTMTSLKRQQALSRAVCSGLPVVRVGRGNTEGFARIVPPFVGGSNLSATKARILLMAALLKLGALTPARDPRQPTREELARIHDEISAFQHVFDTH